MNYINEKLLPGTNLWLIHKAQLKRGVVTIQKAKVESYSLSMGKIKLEVKIIGKHKVDVNINAYHHFTKIEDAYKKLEEAADPNRFVVIPESTKVTLAGKVAVKGIGISSEEVAHITNRQRDYKSPVIKTNTP
jgi:hypothetical protein